MPHTESPEGSPAESIEENIRAALFAPPTADEAPRYGLRSHQAVLVELEEDSDLEDEDWLPEEDDDGFYDDLGLEIDEDDEDDDDDDDESLIMYWGNPTRPQQQFYPPQQQQPAGMRLVRSGDFGAPLGESYTRHRVLLGPSPSCRIPGCRITSSSSPRNSPVAVPNSPGTEVAEFAHRVYTGQYSPDGSFFYSACKDFGVYLFDTSKSLKASPTARDRRRGAVRSSLPLARVVRAREHDMTWTITDAHISQDNRWLIYSTINPNVHLSPTGFHLEPDEPLPPQQILEIEPHDHRGFYSSCGIWSLRFSHDGNEIVAGGRDGQMYVYDIASSTTLLRISAHVDDVNAVSFADDASRNLLLSGSDDTLVKVWDRRSLKDEKPSGVLVGHTEGITYVAPKGDGRYCISNGKDQGIKLWDLRMMLSDSQVDRLRLDVHDFYRIRNWDYRQGFYRRPVVTEHPNDVSVMTYRGHSVLKTLIRCHFSPAATTSQQYIYSGSSDGFVHVWHIDGTPIQKIDRSLSQSLLSDGHFSSPDQNDPSRLERISRPHRTIRDVSWHPFEPNMISTSWDSDSDLEGSLVYHPWTDPKAYHFADAGGVVTY